MRKLKKMTSAVILSAMLSLSIAGAVSAKVIDSDHGHFDGGIRGDYVYSSYYDTDYNWYSATAIGQKRNKIKYKIGQREFGRTAFVTSLKKGSGNEAWYDFGGGKH